MKEKKKETHNLPVGGTLEAEGNKTWVENTLEFYHHRRTCAERGLERRN